MIFIVIFVLFITLYLGIKTGNYESRLSKAKRLTEEQIKVFEQDIADNKEIDINEYLLSTNKDYSSKLSNNIYKTSIYLEQFIDKSIRFIFNR